MINGRIRTMDANCSLAEVVFIAGDRYSLWNEHVYCGAEAKNLEDALNRLAERAKRLVPGEPVLIWGF